MPKENDRSNIINEGYMNVLSSFKSRVISILIKVKLIFKQTLKHEQDYKSSRQGMV